MTRVQMLTIAEVRQIPLGEIETLLSRAANLIWDMSVADAGLSEDHTEDAYGEIPRERIDHARKWIENVRRLRNE